MYVFVASDQQIGILRLTSLEGTAFITLTIAFYARTYDFYSKKHDYIQTNNGSEFRRPGTKIVIVCVKHITSWIKWVQVKNEKPYRRQERKVIPHKEVRFFWPCCWRSFGLLLFAWCLGFRARFQSARPSILSCPTRERLASCLCRCVAADLSLFREAAQMSPDWKNKHFCMIKTVPGCFNGKMKRQVSKFSIDKIRISSESDKNANSVWSFAA